MTTTTRLDEQKKTLERLYRERETLERAGLSLQEAKKLARKTVDAVTEAIPEGSYGSPLDGTLASLDDVILKLEELDKQGDERADQVEREIVVLEGTAGVLCRCHGEIECEEQGKPAPEAVVALTGFTEQKVGRKYFKYGRYKMRAIFQNDYVMAEGSNGNVVGAAESFWEKHGFDKHGAYKHVLGLCEKLKQEALDKVEE